MFLRKEVQGRPDRYKHLADRPTKVIRLQPLLEQAGHSRTLKASQLPPGSKDMWFFSLMLHRVWPHWCTHSFTTLLAYHTRTCFPNWENWKDFVKLLYHNHWKLIHFKALILIFDASRELWLGFQAKTPFFFNASLHHRSCYKQRVTAWKTFRLAQGKSTIFSVVPRQLRHWGKSLKVTQNLPNYSSKELPKSYYKNIFLAVAS